jgi:hypothetical protein
VERFADMVVADIAVFNEDLAGFAYRDQTPLTSD